MKESLVVRVDGATPIILNGEKSIILGILGTLSPWRSTKLSPGMGKQCADATSMRPGVRRSVSTTTSAWRAQSFAPRLAPPPGTPAQFLPSSNPKQSQCQCHAPLCRQHGVTRNEHQPQEVVANVVVQRGFKIRHGLLCWAFNSRPSSSCLRSSRLVRRNMSMARFLAAAISQAPGLSGIPDWGHCSSAATSAA